MKHYKICVYAICKNEAGFVDRWMDSMSEADCIVVTDTGSTDDTVQRLRNRGAVVYQETFSPWRFDAARNRSLEHVPDDTDICVCTDLDEVLRPGWRAHLEAHWTPDATMGNYLFNWSLHPDGTPATQFVYFKVHKKNDYTWVFPAHECLRYIGKGAEKKVFISDMVLDHFPDQTKSRGSYLGLLEMGAEEQPDSDRAVYYLGREYMYAGMWEKCIATLKRHLALPCARWKEERCASMRWIAKSYHQLGKDDECYRWYFRAMAEAPALREPYVELARVAYEKQDWVTVYLATQQALKIKKRNEHYPNSPIAWNHIPEDLAALSCYYLGMYKQSLIHAQNAIALAPHIPRLQKNLELIQQKI